ncbi:DUF4270 domain-containing protein [Winogradskyella thalassocola]|uniref:DUF4270 domain-containing protein n=1 Tax=Winogradskyella thalassocola TaxID=262004 RepID=A0A1G7W2X3_9FLAO|nr:DUF4270 domain-containing protein [Winogradskyella thalassocola]SDG66231.1 protein of unknown function [Winogradskyella thalassocola]
MKKNKIALQILSIGLIVLSFSACDDDFVSLESDLINSGVATNFDIDSDKYDVVAYTKALAPVQTNRLGLTTLGIYDDAYGRTTSSFVTQLTPITYNPTFGDEAKIDSVVVTLPYFSTATGIDDDGNITYTLDSVISKGENYNNIKLRIFENNYFIRDFDPSAGFNEEQAYYSDQTASSSETISTTALEGAELTFVDYDNDTGSIMTVVNNEIDINDKGYSLKDVNELDENGDKTLLLNQSPGIRIMLEPSFWEDKILAKEGDPVLSNLNNFTEYFRGLYFKAEAVNDDGSFLVLNTGSTNNANITIYYSKLTASTTDGADIRDNSTYVLNFGSNKINFLVNDFTLPIDNGDSDAGDSRIYLKGGQGAIAGIKLFDGYDDEAGMTKFDKFRNDFVNLNPEDDTFESSKRLVNEANLVFYVDRDQLDLLNEDPENEPNRLYLYDVPNKTPLIDYYLDVTNTALPSFSKIRHLGALQRVDDEPSSKGVKYKLKITEHINNLLLRDSTNVELGLAVSLNVNIEDPSVSFSQNKVQTVDDLDLTVPVSSILTPRGTILYGNNTPESDQSKRVYLEIYYTEPNY